MRGTSGLWRRPVWVGTAVLLVCVLLEGIPAVRLWTVAQVPAFALLDGIRMPGPLPAVGVPLGTDPAWSHWAAELVGGLCLPLVFAAWMSREGTKWTTVLRRSWVATTVAVVAGCLVRAVLESVMVPEGFTSFLILIGGTVLIGAVVGAVMGVPVGLVCCALARRRAHHGRVCRCRGVVSRRRPGTLRRVTSSRRPCAGRTPSPSVPA